MSKHGITVTQISPRLTLTRFDLKRGVYCLEHEDELFHKEQFFITAKELRTICDKLHLK